MGNLVTLEAVRAVLLGLAVGDALGVPVEFKSRAEIAPNPVTDMWGYGTHQQPAGTFSDDSSLAFCLAESLAVGLDLEDLSDRFVQWLYHAYWTAHGETFDVGIASRKAIARLRAGEEPELAGGMEERDNGNGALMRIAPLLFHIYHLPARERYVETRRVCALTHGHMRSAIACHFYLDFARLLLMGMDKLAAYEQVKSELPSLLDELGIVPEEQRHFDRLLLGDIHRQQVAEIQSSGYVLHTLEASVWCLLTTDSYPEAVLSAVNLGDDTDTTGAVTGALAGLLYGVEGIPGHWLRQLARLPDIEDLAARLAGRYA
jgi:ADP-ribosylglycohydrolase